MPTPEQIREVLEAETREAMREEVRQAFDVLHTTRRLRLVTFESRSNGKNRPK